MALKVKNVTDVIESFAPLSLQEKWDNSGLCVGSPEAEVNSVLPGLDCTEELVDEAIECGADMIVTHHPLIFSGLKRISPDDQVGAAVIKAVKAGISIYAAHTSADKVISGAWVLIVLYFFLTVAELFISPLGLSFVSKVAPRHMVGLCQGLWLGATALGNLMLWVGPLMYNAWPIWQCWTVFLAVCLISMGIMLGMVKWLERVAK